MTHRDGEERLYLGRGHRALHRPVVRIDLDGLGGLALHGWIPVRRRPALRGGVKGAVAVAVSDAQLAERADLGVVVADAGRALGHADEDIGESIEVDVGEEGRTVDGEAGRQGDRAGDHGGHRRRRRGHRLGEDVDDGDGVFTLVREEEALAIAKRPEEGDRDGPEELLPAVTFLDLEENVVLVPVGIGGSIDELDEVLEVAQREGGRPLAGVDDQEAHVVRRLAGVALGGVERQVRGGIDGLADAAEHHPDPPAHVEREVVGAGGGELANARDDGRAGDADGLGLVAVGREVVNVEASLAHRQDLFAAVAVEVAGEELGGGAGDEGAHGLEEGAVAAGYAARPAADVVGAAAPAGAGLHRGAGRRAVGRELHARDDRAGLALRVGGAVKAALVHGARRVARGGVPGALGRHAEDVAVLAGLDEAVAAAVFLDHRELGAGGQAGGEEREEKINSLSRHALLSGWREGRQYSRSPPPGFCLAPPPIFTSAMATWESAAGAISIS